MLIQSQKLSVAHQDLPGNNGCSNHAAFESEDDVPREVASREWGGWVIIDENYIGRRAHFQLADSGFWEEHAG